MNRHSVAYILIAVLIFSYFFLIFDVNFRGPDEPIYYAYTASVIEDGDLNAIDQFYKGSAESCSKTYNLPDFHNHGGVVFWSPVYAYGKMLGGEAAAKCALSFSTVIFGFLTLILTFLLCRRMFCDSVSFLSLVLLFFGTPYFYFVFFEPGNGQIIGSLLSIISVFVLYYAIAMKRFHWFLYGMFFSLCVVVKLDLWFQIFLILMVFVVLSLRKEIQRGSILYFFIGFLPIFILNLLNDFIKYGVVHKGELQLFNRYGFYLFDQLFSAYRGYFYTSPVLYIWLFGFILIAISFFKKSVFVLFKDWKITFLCLLALCVFIKIFIISFRYAWGGGTVGARHLLTEFPIFVILFAYAIQNQKRFIRYILYFISSLFVIWNLMVISEFIKGVDIQYLTLAPALGERLKLLNTIFSLLTGPREVSFKFSVSAPLIIGMLFIFVVGLREKGRALAQEFPLKIMSFIAIYACLAYGLVTYLNLVNNKRNVEVLTKKGFFKDTVVLSSKDYERAENVGSMEEMMVYFNLKNNLAMVEKIRKVKAITYGD